MKDMFRKFAFVGILTLSGFAFAEEKKASTSDEAIQVVCPVNTDEDSDTTNNSGESTVEEANE
jgi:hypothetical protein